VASTTETAHPSTAAAAARGVDLLNPHTYDPAHFDHETRRLLRATIDWFESRGKERLTREYHEHLFYSEFLEFVAGERLFATFLTPAEQAGGNPDKRWDTARIAAMSEVLGFYGINYWYPWQVTVLGLGPVWQSAGAAAKGRAADVLERGGVRALRARARRRHLLDRHDPHAGRQRRLPRDRWQVLHRQRQLCRDRVGVRADRRRRGP
jgi:hypothetical protein